MLRRDLVVDVEADVEAELQLGKPADRVLGDDPHEVGMAVEYAVEDQIGECDLGVETVHHEALARHVLDDVVRLPTVVDDPLGERTDVERGAAARGRSCAHTGSKSGCDIRLPSQVPSARNTCLIPPAASPSSSPSPIHVAAKGQVTHRPQATAAFVADLDTPSGSMRDVGPL